MEDTWLPLQFIEAPRLLTFTQKYMYTYTPNTWITHLHLCHNSPQNCSTNPQSYFSPRFGCKFGVFSYSSRKVLHGINFMRTELQLMINLTLLHRNQWKYKYGMYNPTDNKLLKMSIYYWVAQRRHNLFWSNKQRLMGSALTKTRIFRPCLFHGDCQVNLWESCSCTLDKTFQKLVLCVL